MSRSKLIEKPILAMIHGYCLGGGVAMAMGADIRICADDAQFGIPAARLGVGYPYESTAALVALGLIGAILYSVFSWALSTLLPKREKSS